MRRKFSKNTGLRSARQALVDLGILVLPTGSNICIGHAEHQKVYLRTKNSRLRAFLFVVLALLAVSCFDKGDCLYVEADYISFKVMNRLVRNRTDTIQFYSVSTPGTGIWYEDKKLTYVYTGVNPDAGEIKYVFSYQLETGAQRTDRLDTLIVGYTRQARVLSPECGSVTHFDNLEIKYSTLPEDNVVIKVKPLLKSVTANIEIYL